MWYARFRPRRCERIGWWDRAFDTIGVRDMAERVRSSAVRDRVLLATLMTGAIAAGTPAAAQVSPGASHPPPVPAWIAAMVPMQPSGADDGQAPTSSELQTAGDRAHAQLLIGDRYPSATECKKCHETHYKQWSVSQHAYAQMSPVFNAMHGKILKLTNGTNGDFCIRCHTPVGMNLEEPVFMSNINRHPTSREGVTCIVCHRVDKAYNKVSGRIALVMGSEGRGLRRLVAKGCDGLAALPMSGPMESLNVSAAAAIALYEVARQREARSPTPKPG